ncbi:ATP-binding protein [Actinomadura kijaniata]|uniref:ATP-binding protein n=1 Tax=Actinomadura kijaniata TaxID=46161 RepID=UPI0009FF2062|nr:LuxR C-terminal-related transcriptional regulator [Actinomadura kijaniata]
MTTFVGRGAELALVRQALSRARLVTLTGVGGVGKTRLGLRVAEEARPSFPDGVWLVELSSLHDPTLLADRVCRALRLQDQSARSQLEVLADYLADQRALLLLDTCEHLVDACTLLAETLLRAAPRLCVLTTTRQPLGIPGEHVIPVPPLASPPPRGPDPAEPWQDALLLFADRAAAADPTFSLSEGNLEAASQLCRRLDGIPLAIELAAVQLRVLSVAQLAARLDDRFRILGRRARISDQRHHTLQSAIEWSHELCTGAERLLWARLSVFAGDFDLESAEDVCAGDELTDVLEPLIGLVDKSIVLRRDTSDGVRFAMLDTLREYGRDRLRAAGQETALLHRHRDHCLDLARRCNAGWGGRDQLDWCGRLHPHYADIAAALTRCATDPAQHRAGLTLAAELGFYWMASGHLKQGCHFLGRLLELCPDPTPERAWALWVRGWMAVPQGDFARAERHAAEAREIAEALGLAATRAYAVYTLATAAIMSGDLDRGIALCREAIDAHRAAGDTGVGQTLARTSLALGLLHQGHPDRAVTELAAARRPCEALGEMWARSFCDLIRSMAEQSRGDVPATVRYARAALEVKHRLGDQPGTAAALDVLAGAAMADGDGERAARLLGAAQGCWTRAGAAQAAGAPALLAARDACEEAALALVGEERYDAAFQDGLRAPIADAVGYALDQTAALAPSRGEPCGGSPLSPRERQVAELVAQGMSNREIAERLVISRRTADSHIEHILGKLGFNSRTQIAVWMTRRS